MISRRAVLGGLTAGALFSRFGSAQQPSPIEAKKLGDRLTVLMGDGGNIVMVSSPDGLLLVDAGLPDRANDLVKAVGAPVRTVFNTHWHFDHVGANEVLGKAGARIVAHDTVRVRMSSKQSIEALKMDIEPMGAAALPAITFSESGSLFHGNEVLQYTHVAPAHTDGDAYVFFPNSNVLHTGDLVFNGFYPFIDYSSKGWIGGMVHAADKLLTVGDEQTTIVPGHGPLANRKELKVYRDMLTTVYKRLAPMSKAGKPVDEVAAASPLKDLDEAWGKGFMKPEVFVRVAYTSILRHNQRG